MSSEKNTIINIRLAMTKEALCISDLLYDSFAGYKSFYTEKAFAATTPGIHEIRARIGENLVWVAFYNHAMAGTVSLVPSGNGVFIKSVAVKPAARRNGVAKELMRQAEEIAIKKGAKYLELTTTPFLFEAIRLYEFFGFKQYGYDDLYGTPLIKMIKYLNETYALSEEAMRFDNQ